MQKWKAIAKAPKDQSILVIGGTLESELNGPTDMDEPVKVSFIYNKFYAVDTCGYSVWVNNPTHWQYLPKMPQ